MFDLIDKLEDKETLEREEWITLLSAYQDDALRDYAAQKARAVAQSVYGHDVYVRGLIEFTNYCRNDCYYCGIRRSNPDADRYRLTRIFLPAVRRAGSLVSGPLSCREARMDISGMNGMRS